MATAEKLVAVAAAASEVVDWALAQSSGGCADAEGALSPVPIADRDCGFIFSQTQPSLDLFTVLFARPPQSLQVRRARTVRILLRIQGGGKSPPPRYNSNCTKERSSAEVCTRNWVESTQSLQKFVPGTGCNPPSPRPLKAPFSPSVDGVKIVCL